MEWQCIRKESRAATGAPDWGISVSQQHQDVPAGDECLWILLLRASALEVLEIHKDVRRAPSDDDNPSAALTPSTAVGSAAANLEDLQD